MRFLRKLHKWLSLLLGLQVLLWVLSGLVISLLDPLKVSGQQWAASQTSSPGPIPALDLLEPEELPVEYLGDVLEISLTTHFGATVYRITRSTGVTLLNAVDGTLITISKAEAKKIALQDFTGDGEIISIGNGSAPDLATRNHRGGYWKVNFSDHADTSVYVSEATGEILERRNDYWRLRDFFWMLHIMDYQEREDLNNALVIGVTLVALWIGISGFVLLFGSFKRRDFRFLKIPGLTQHDR
jgi:uncharacterized iron-regulated membrane protein